MKNEPGSVGARQLICLAALLAGIFWCGTGCVTLKDASMPGMVYSRDGKPLQGVAVRVDGQILTWSDANGRFRVDGLRLELQRDKPWQEVELPALSLELQGYRSVVIPAGSTLRSLPEQTRGMPVLWCRMSSARDLMHDAWNLMERTHWASARKLLEEALSLEPESKILKQSLDLALLKEKSLVPEGINP